MTWSMASWGTMSGLYLRMLRLFSMASRMAFMANLLVFIE